MTEQQQSETPPALEGGRLAARASVPGAVVSLVLVAVAMCLVPSEVHWFIAGGAVAAMTAGALGAVLLARAAVVEPGDPKNGLMFVQALVYDFGIQFVAVVTGVSALHFLGMKFAGVAAFGITFAGVALVVHVAGAVLMNRALSMRARYRES